VVHRDLKPSNIMVDGDGHPQLLDFGIAKLLDLPVDASETATGLRALSPAYAAPEQVLGEPISTATDVYALGIVLYELLTGRLPHDRRSASLETLAESVRTEVTERPSLALRRQSDSTGSAMSLSRQAREVSGELDLIVLTAMRREPERRYANAAALGEDLQRWLDGRPIAAQADTAGYRARKFVGRHRLAVGSASAVLLALIAGFGIALWQASVARSEAARAEAQAEAAREQTARVKRVKDFMMSIFVSEDPLRRTSGEPLSLADAYAHTLQRIDAEFTDDPALQADLLDDFGEIEAGRGDLPAAVRLIERALEMAEKAHGPNHPAVAESLLNLGVLAGYRGHAVDGRERLERAVAILEPLADAEHELLASALGGLSAVYHHEGQMDVVIDLSRRALAALQAAPKPDQRRLAVMRNNLALALFEQQRLEESEAEVLQAIALTEQVNGTDSANLAPMLEMLEQVRHAQGDLLAERTIAERRLAIVRAAFAGDHEWVARAMGETGYFMARDGEIEAGDARMRESIAMYERLDDQRVFQVKRRFAIELAGRGDLQAARALFGQALKNCDASRPKAVPCHTIRANRAEVMARLGEFDAALVEADLAIAALREITGANSELNQAREARAAALSGLGRKAEALQEQSAALESYRALLPDSHPTVRRSEAKLKALRSES
jgi:serine/threonine-protein kinase